MNIMNFQKRESSVDQPIDEETKISFNIKEEQYAVNSISDSKKVEPNILQSSSPQIEYWDENSEKLLIQLYLLHGDNWQKFTRVFDKITQHEIEEKFFSILEWTMDAQTRIFGNSVKFESKNKEVLLSFLPKVVKMLKASPDNIPINILAKLEDIDNPIPNKEINNKPKWDKEDIIESLKRRIQTEFDVKYEKSWNKRRKLWEKYDSDSFSE